MGKVIWFTGLSGSGKSTLALALKEEFEKKGKKVLIVDGDAVRNTITKGLGFSREDIHKNNMVIATLVARKIDEYDYILVPIISPYAKDRLEAKNIIDKEFYLLYIECSLDTVVERDVKGLYKKALAGEIKNLIGFSDSNTYDIPESPDIIVNTEMHDLNTCIKTILSKINF